MRTNKNNVSNNELRVDIRKVFIKYYIQELSKNVKKALKHKQELIGKNKVFKRK